MPIKCQFKNNSLYNNNINNINSYKLLNLDLNLKNNNIKNLNTINKEQQSQQQHQKIKQHASSHRIFKLLKFTLIKMEEDKTKLHNIENIQIEWKELARRVEYFFFTITFLVIIMAPILLFGKFFMRDVVTKSHLNAPCGCEHSFVKNI